MFKSISQLHANSTTVKISSMLHPLAQLFHEKVKKLTEKKLQL